MIAAGVIGWPVAHSKSPLIHRFWLAKLGFDGDYGRFAVHPDDLGEAIRALPALGLRGVNVTVPHKVAVMACLDRVDQDAAEAGAVNTVVVEGGKLIGFNTDVTGFHDPLANWGNEMQGRPTHLHLIGTGGAARAIAYGWGSGLTIHGRDSGKTAALAAEVARVGNGEVEASDLAALAQRGWVKTDRVGQPLAIVVANATTLGMADQPPLTVDLAALPDDTIVYDVVYAPLETPLLAAARARGLRTIDGLAMLIGQAAAAFALFFGAPAPREHDAELRSLLTGTGP